MSIGPNLLIMLHDGCPFCQNIISCCMSLPMLKHSLTAKVTVDYILLPEN